MKWPRSFRNCVSICAGRYVGDCRRHDRGHSTRRNFSFASALNHFNTEVYIYFYTDRQDSGLRPPERVQPRHGSRMFEPSSIMMPIFERYNKTKAGGKLEGNMGRRVREVNAIPFFAVFPLTSCTGTIAATTYERHILQEFMLILTGDVVNTGDEHESVQRVCSLRVLTEVLN